MTRPIPRRVREQAAMICAIGASSFRNGVFQQHCYDWQIAEWLGLWHGSPTATRQRSPAISLALAAWDEAYDGVTHHWTAEVDAEAEALLRTGWCPDE